MGYQFNPFTGNFDIAGGGSAQVNSDWNASTGVAQILNKPSLATVATSGAYSDLTGKPTLFSGAYSSLTGVPSSFTPSAHASSHASGGSDALTLAATQITSGTLADAQLSSNVPLINAGNSFSAGQTITSAANTSALTASYSVTGANTTPLLNLSGTWNTTGVAQGILLNITDTASSGNSKLLDLQVGGASKFSFRKGNLIVTDTSFTFAVAGGSNAMSINSTFGINVRNYIGVTNGNGGTGTSDCYLYSDGANTLALRNGTNAQTSRIYGTYTDASNGRRLDITSTTGGIFTLTATGNGTGASGNLLKLTQPILLPASSVTLATNGDLAFEATSNTTLTIRYRGSDGTTRSAALTLA
jgi:hypothetical protein